MKSEGKVRHQLAQVIFRYRKKMVAAELSPVAHNCVHNRRSALLGKTLGVCGYKEGQPEALRVVCDVNLCPDVARACSFFQPRSTPEALKELFHLQLESLLAQAQHGQPGYLAHHYPDVAALLWVLEEDPQQTTALRLLEEEHDPNAAPSDPPSEGSAGEGAPPPDEGSR